MDQCAGQTDRTNFPEHYVFSHNKLHVVEVGKIVFYKLQEVFDSMWKVLSSQNFDDVGHVLAAVRMEIKLA